MRPNMNDRFAAGTPSRNLGHPFDRWLNSTKFVVMQNYLNTDKRDLRDNWDKYNHTRRSTGLVRDIAKFLFPGSDAWK